MRIALVGQPNSGKSTLFNAVAGYRSLTSNFAGTTVEYAHGQAHVDGQVLELADLPGLYSLTPASPVEAVSRQYLLAGGWDVVVNVVDASQLARSLELTLELLDLEAPLVICLNMMDEAARKGMTIDSHGLEAALGVPVVEAITSRGRGIIETFRAAQQSAAGHRRSRPFLYSPGIEAWIERLAEKILKSDRVRGPQAPPQTTDDAHPLGSVPARAAGPQCYNRFSPPQSSKPKPVVVAVEESARCAQETAQHRQEREQAPGRTRMDQRPPS